MLERLIELCKRVGVKGGRLILADEEILLTRSKIRIIHELFQKVSAGAGI